MNLIKVILKSIFLIVLASAAVSIYALKIEPNTLTTKRYEINQNTLTADTVKVIQLSDIELSQYYTEKNLPAIVSEVNALNPDLIVFTGDLFDNYAKYRPVKEVINALNDLDAVYGKFAIWGNNDYGGGAVRHYEEIMEKSGFQVLKNEGVNIKLETGVKIFIGGLDDNSLGTPDIDRTMKAADADCQYRILLSHEPTQTHELNKNPIDLVLSGHTHGGQVNLPFFKTIADFLDIESMNGFYQLDTPQNTQLYVHSGMGTSRIHVRFMVPPQIASFQISLSSDPVNTDLAGLQNPS